MYVIEGAVRDRCDHWHRSLSWAAKQNVNQRAGRTGRTGPGKVYFLFPKEFYEAMSPVLVPEMERPPLNRPVLEVLSQRESPKRITKLAKREWQFLESKLEEELITNDASMGDGF